jgi:hypothetical protein
MPNVIVQICWHGFFIFEKDQMKNNNKEKKMIVVFVMLLMLISFPIMSILQNEIIIGFVPSKILIIFVIWVVVIITAAIIINRK